MLRIENIMQLVGYWVSDKDEDDGKNLIVIPQS